MPEPDVEAGRCPKCGADYKIVTRKYQMQEAGHFDCEKCGHRLREWKGALDDLFGPETVVDDRGDD